MTDLTAAQLVERLKDTTAESWRWELAAATLIGQQVEQLRDAHRDALVNKQTADKQAEQIAARDAAFEVWSRTESRNPDEAANFDVAFIEAYEATKGDTRE